MNHKSKAYFRGLCVLITGASSGIGEAFSKKLASLGANLILVSRSLDKLVVLKEELLKKNSIEIEVFDIDLSKPESVKILHEKVCNRKFSVDILINNAGFGKQGTFDSFSLETYQEMVQLDIVSLVNLTRLFIPKILERNKGGIINLSSTAAFQPLPYMAVYSAIKSFVLLFSEALWGEYNKKGIRVLAVCPGHTKTNFHKIAGVPSNRIFNLGDPYDVVDKSLDAFVNGQPYVVPGKINFFLAQLHRFFPRKISIRIASKVFD